MVDRQGRAKRGGILPALLGLAACNHPQHHYRLPATSFSCFQPHVLYLLFCRKQLAKLGSKKQWRKQLVKRDRKLPVLKMKRLKDTYDGGGGEGRASCP